MAGVSVMTGLLVHDLGRTGRYPAGERLGEDNLGTLYLARLPSGQQIVLRVLAPALAGSPRIRERLEREIHTAAAVTSPFTTRIVDADIRAREPWIATEYAPGPTMDLLVERQGPLGLARLLAVAAALSAGLRDIHQAGLAHKDLQPSRVIIAADRPRITDLGAAVSGLEALAATGSARKQPCISVP